MINQKFYDPDYVEKIATKTKHGIPRIIHQVWIDEKNTGMPKDWDISPEKWKKYHPEYIYILWDKDNSLSFIQKYFPEMCDIYINFPYVIQRCNLIRYLFLYKYGGIYCDLDNFPTENIEKFLDHKAKLYLPEARFAVFTGIDINIIITQKNNPVFIDILNHIKKTCKNTYLTKFQYVLNTDGLNIFYDYLKTNKDDIYVLPHEFFGSFPLGEQNFKYDPNKVLMSVKGGTWYDSSVDIINFIVRNYIIIFVYLIILILIILMIYFWCTSYNVYQTKIT